MLISSQKRKENISEYLIYMFQVEDMIRACKLDINTIDQQIISQYHDSYDVKREIREWYKAIISMMKDNNNEEKGHIPLLETLLKDLNEIHIQLISKSDNKTYSSLYQNARQAIEELKIKSGDKEISDIKASFNGLYGYLLLKISSKTINPETETAISHITKMLAMLGTEFHKLERGESGE